MPSYQGYQNPQQMGVTTTVVDVRPLSERIVSEWKKMDVQGKVGVIVFISLTLLVSIPITYSFIHDFIRMIREK